MIAIRRDGCSPFIFMTDCQRRCSLFQAVAARV
jgi:hypothetical protein